SMPRQVALRWAGEDQSKVSVCTTASKACRLGRRTPLLFMIRARLREARAAQEHAFLGKSARVGAFDSLTPRRHTTAP
ncbi:hypothetical protein, partial [Xanthomonas phaseoli]|uniref:hypothetical protein n=1 Tax=Xanthomonas phaseoli TaxID=1985254 RepID=UPI001C55688A